MHKATAMKNQMQILFIGAEAEPFIKIGGLGDVAGVLPAEILKLTNENASQKVDVRIVLPLHQQIKQKFPGLQKAGSFQVKNRTEILTCDYYQEVINHVTVYLLDGEPIRNATTVYSSEPEKDGEKYVFFSIAALELARHLNFQVDILQANDWHTASAVYALKTRYKNDAFFKETKSILSLHNLPYMGYGIQKALLNYDLPPTENESLPEWARHAPLPLGLLSADLIITVSPHYAAEILTPQFGCTLESFLNNRSESVIGIVNGIDLTAWDPATDANIVQNFDLDTLAQRVNNKTSLQKTYHLKIDPNMPLLTFVSRMDHQKGIDIALKGLQQSLGMTWQAIFLGTGDPSIEALATDMAASHPEHVAYINKFDARVAHQLYAGADMFLMPSRYEPCGISQMIAMRYGCVPIARATGGLVDTIINTTGNSTGTGFLFKNAYPSSLKQKLSQALTCYQSPQKWQQIQRNGMMQDFSWRKSAVAYLEKYNQLIKAGA